MSVMKQRAVAWLVAATICGVGSNLWQLQVAAEEFALGVAVAERPVLWRVWMAAPWIYLFLQVWRLGGDLRSLRWLGLSALATVVGGILVWQFHITELPPRNRTAGVALLPMLQGGVLALTGLVLWLAGRWRGAAEEEAPEAGRGRGPSR